MTHQKNFKSEGHARPQCNKHKKACTLCGTTPIFNFGKTKVISQQKLQKNKLNLVIQHLLTFNTIHLEPRHNSKQQCLKD